MECALETASGETSSASCANAPMGIASAKIRSSKAGTNFFIGHTFPGLSLGTGRIVNTVIVALSSSGGSSSGDHFIELLDGTSRLPLLRNFSPEIPSARRAESPRRRSRSPVAITQAAKKSTREFALEHAMTVIGRVMWFREIIVRRDSPCGKWELSLAGNNCVENPQPVSQLRRGAHRRCSKMRSLWRRRFESESYSADGSLRQ